MRKIISISLLMITFSSLYADSIYIAPPQRKSHPQNNLETFEEGESPIQAY